MFCSVNVTAAFIEPAPPDLDGPAEARACAGEARRERQLGMLQELAEIGMEMARAVRDEVLARADAAGEGAEAPARASPFGAADLGLVYSRIARAVRQSIALETRVAEGIEKARVERERRGVEAARRGLERRQADIRDFVAQAVEAEAAERKTPDEGVERLLDDLDERLADGDYDDVLADAPIAELVARICLDLGVTPDWRIWDDQDWAIEHLKAHTPDDIGAERWGRPASPDGGAAASPDVDAPDPESG
jgi:hypothetical protein